MPCGSLLYFDCLRNVLRRRAGRKGLVFPFRLSVSFLYALRKAVFALRINGGSPFGLAVMQLCREHIGDGCRLSVRGCVAEAYRPGRGFFRMFRLLLRGGLWGGSEEGLRCGKGWVR